MNKDVLDTLRDYKDKCEGLENINDKLSNALLSAENKINKYKEVIDKAIEYIKEKQKIQYKFALSHIECDDLLQILEDKEVSE